MSLTRRVLDHFVIPAGDLPPRTGGNVVTRDDGSMPACEMTDELAAVCEMTDELAAACEVTKLAAAGEVTGEPTAACEVTREAIPAYEVTDQPTLAGEGWTAPDAVAVLTAAPDAPALGAAFGLALARRRRAPVVAVCVRNPGGSPWPPWRAPALPAARRLAAGLAARGHDARPAGRLALVRLGGTDDDAALAARRALAATGAAPTVLALSGPRAPAFDALLTEQDLVVVGAREDADPILTRLAIAGLDGVVRACACEVPAAHPARSLAAAGIALLPSMRRALAGPMAELAS
jgi:hypothetical protein